MSGEGGKAYAQGNCQIQTEGVIQLPYHLRKGGEWGSWLDQLSSVIKKQLKV